MTGHKKTPPIVAALWGLLSVNGPVLILLCSAPIAGLVVWQMSDPWIPAIVSGFVGLMSAFLVWCLAWLAWAINAPRWRLWAYERVDNLDRLHGWAVSFGILWSEGHFFERTEIYPGRLRERVEAARQRRD